LLINTWARKPTRSPQLDTEMRKRLVGPDPCSAALAHLAREAIELVTGREVERIRDCANPTCSLMFIDHSRPGRRRWCAMATCGNRAKTGRYRERRRSFAANQAPGQDLQRRRT
jgi:predicted RNA-binding Zn ribbon-like protein